MKHACPHIAAGNKCPIQSANGKKGGWPKGKKRGKPSRKEGQAK
jgi:hypothetical protein